MAITKEQVELPLLLTLKESAKLLSCCTRTLYNLQSDGSLHFLRQRGSIRISRNEIMRYLAGLELSTEAAKSTSTDIK